MTVRDIYFRLLTSYGEPYCRAGRELSVSNNTKSKFALVVETVLMIALLKLFVRAGLSRLTRVLLSAVIWGFHTVPWRPCVLAARSQVFRVRLLLFFVVRPAAEQRIRRRQLDA